MKCKYNIANLDCAKCAMEVEEALNKDAHIQNARVNFSTLKVTFETDVDGNPKKYAEKIIKGVEPDATIYEGEVREENTQADIIRLMVGLLLVLTAYLFKEYRLIYWSLIVISYIVLVCKTALRAFRTLVNSKSLNENALITISSIGALIIGKEYEGFMVIFLYEIGKILEASALAKSRKNISDLMNIKPEYANLKTGKTITKMSPSEVNVNDVIVVKTGEKVPLDGTIIKGNADLDTSSLTGESALRSVGKKKMPCYQECLLQMD